MGDKVGARSWRGGPDAAGLAGTTIRSAKLVRTTVDFALPLLSTKLSSPSPHAELLTRPRLIDRLNDVLHSKVTLITAPAGFGKTTLLGQWIAGVGSPVAWVSLDAGDNDPTQFFSYIAAALGGRDVQIEAAVPRSVHRPRPREWNILLATLINAVDASAVGDMVLVLDDYHVIENGVVHRGMSFLIDHLPPCLHLVLASRKNPPFPLARLRGRGELNELRAADLKFMPEESAHFLTEIVKLRLSADELAAVDRRAEGWAVGLRIAALLMRESGNVADFIRAFSGSHHYISDYLIEEALRQQPNSLQRFMLQTSILDHLNEPLCAAVTGLSDTKARLEQLARANLFVVPVGDEGEWYRYHQLFAETLRDNLRQLYPNEVPELHVRASKWFMANGLVQEALQHALAAGDVSSVADLVERTAIAYASRGDLARSTAATAGVVDEAGRVAAVEPTTQSRNVDIAYWWTNNVARASEMLAQANLMNRALGYRFNAVSSMTQLAGLQIIRGQLRQAGESYQQGMDLAREFRGQWASSEGAPSVGMGLLCYEWNRLGDAVRFAVDGMELGQQGENPAVMLGGVSILAVIEQARGNIDGALDVLRQVEDLARELNLGRWTSATAARRARLWLVQGNLEEAIRWDRAAGLSVDDEPSYLRITEYMSLARVRIAQGKPEEAVRLLDRMLEAAQTAGRAGSAIKILVVRAVAMAQLGDRNEAMANLMQALSRAEPQGYVRTFVDVGPQMRELLIELQKSEGIMPPSAYPGYIGTLLAAFDPVGDWLPSPIPALKTVLERGRPSAGTRLVRARGDTLKERLSERELEVLRLVNTGASNQEIAAELIVALSTVKKHINNMYGKLDVRSRTQAIVKARRLGLLHSDV